MTPTHPLPALILLLTSLVALITCPHSKVEESFNLQASYDLFYHGIELAWSKKSRLLQTPLSASREHDTCDVSAVEEANESCVGWNTLPYDHIRFPGVVPRTFFGAFILSYLARLFAYTIPKQLFHLGSHPMFVQFLIRLELLLLSWFAHLRLAKAVDGYFTRRTRQQSKTPRQTKTASITSTTIGNYYLLITASQFHIPFYSSRLLPNTFALLLVTHAYADWFRGQYRLTAMYLVFTTAIFRCDMLLLLFTVGLSMLIQRQLTVMQAMAIGVGTGLLGLAATVPLDSLLWGRFIWPEFEVWWFNTVDNRSSEWGEMVWHWYFSKALPKGLLFTALLAPLAFMKVPELVDRLERKKSKDFDLVDRSLIPFFAPILGFVALYSLLPHKEIRFIFPALPMFNVCSAYGMSRLHHVAFSDGNTSTNPKQNKTYWFGKAMYLCGFGAIALTMTASLVFLRMSMENYPGGVALERLRSHLVGTVPGGNGIKSKWNSVHVHVNVAAAMTGVSLFGQRHASIRRVHDKDTEYFEGPFTIEKSGYEDRNKLDGNTKSEKLAFTHLLTERSSVDGYHLLEVIKGSPRLEIKNARISTQDAIFIFEKDDWRR
ncbi:hypothetical protein HJC23_010605 [Cyclotella cryptica]|uniref:Mannosyltransferase n=1 Tax=Cyclotella cryptica TaxID=29204 RepID=A0ABD3PPG9_9STRA|eukprot:CCRYP_012808-RA/>CCRYP_012808-RA protein AED:0.03 eAED:0.03 QI:197/1/1/1/1/1/2/371/601